MTIYELQPHEREKTHLWKITWLPGKQRSGQWLLSYSYNSMLHAALPGAAIPSASPEAVQAVTSYFNGVAERLSARLECAPDFAACGLAHRLSPQRNGEIILQIPMRATSELPKTLLQTVLVRPSVQWKCSAEARAVPVGNVEGLRSFLPASILERVLGELLPPKPKGGPSIVRRPPNAAFGHAAGMRANHCGSWTGGIGTLPSADVRRQR